MDYWRELLDRQHLEAVRQLSRERLEDWSDEAESRYAAVYAAKRAKVAEAPHSGDRSSAVLYRNPDGSVTELTALMEEGYDGEGPSPDLLDRPGAQGRKRGQDGWMELGASGAARRDFLQTNGWSEVRGETLGTQSHTCVWCRGGFTAKRSDALTCRPRCRKALSRARKRVTDNRNGEEHMTTEAVAALHDIRDEIRGLREDLTFQREHGMTPAAAVDEWLAEIQGADD